jgi:hypothetical protein
VFLSLNPYRTRARLREWLQSLDEWDKVRWSG